jgi:hypothetical protein
MYKSSFDNRMRLIWNWIKSGKISLRTFVKLIEREIDDEVGMYTQSEDM